MKKPNPPKSMNVSMILSKLEGKKTYIIAVCIGLLAAAKQLGWVDQETFSTLSMLLTGGGLAALRAAK